MAESTAERVKTAVNKTHCYGDSQSADVDLFFDDSKKGILAHQQILRNYVPWFATYFDSKIGTEKHRVGLPHDEFCAWQLLLRRCYPPNCPVRRYEHAVMLVPLVDKYCIDWLREELREGLLVFPKPPGLGPSFYFDHSDTDNIVRTAAFVAKFPIGSRVFASQAPIASSTGLLWLGRIGRIGRSIFAKAHDDEDAEPELGIEWDEPGFDLQGDAWQIWSAEYPGCPRDAEMCWRHGFQDVVRSWFNMFRDSASPTYERWVFQDLAASIPALKHYVHEATSFEVLQLASHALQIHLSESEKRPSTLATS
jgi:hypothetical protein